MGHPERFRKSAHRPGSGKNLPQNSRLNRRLDPQSAQFSVEDLVASTTTRFVFRDGYCWKTCYLLHRIGVLFVIWVVKHYGSQLRKVYRIDDPSGALSGSVL